MSFIKNIFHIRTPEMQGRIIFLDHLRGILMLLVLLQHASAPGSNYILQFHMPALFFLSGYTEFVTNRQYSLREYIKNRGRRLIVPYVCFELVNYVLYLFVCGLSRLGVPLGSVVTEATVFDAFVSIVTCINNSYKGLYGRLWFLPAMFCSSLYAFMIKNLIARKRWLQWIFVPVLLGLSFVSSEILPVRLPFGADIALLGAAFLLLGSVAGPWMDRLINKRHLMWDLIIGLGGAGLFVACNVFGDPVCLMYENEYVDYWYMVTAALAGTVLLTVLCKWGTVVIRKLPLAHKLTVWYSVNSLATFPVHLTIKLAMLLGMKIVGFENWVVLFLGMLLLNIPVVNFITHYLPLMLGLEARKTTKTRA